MKNTRRTYFEMNDFWFSKSLNEDVKVKAEAVADEWFDRGDWETPPDGDFQITSLVMEFHRYDENENEIPITFEVLKTLKAEFTDWLYDNQGLFKEC